MDGLCLGNTACKCCSSGYVVTEKEAPLKPGTGHKSSLIVACLGRGVGCRVRVC